MNHTQRHWQILIGRKNFLIEIAPSQGTKVHLTEKSKDKSFSISIHWSTLWWITENLKSLLISPLNQKFFKETRVDDQVILIEKVTSKRGFPFKLVKLDYNGGKELPHHPRWWTTKRLEVLCRTLTSFYSSDVSIPIMKANHQHTRMLSLRREKRIPWVPQKEVSHGTFNEPATSLVANQSTTLPISSLVPFTTNNIVVTGRKDFPDDSRGHSTWCYCLWFHCSLPTQQSNFALSRLWASKDSG